jgi:hypothetical protein
MDYVVVVPWYGEVRRDAFLEAWGVVGEPDWLVMQHDLLAEGCGATKNAGVVRAMDRGAEVVVVLDDDCYPVEERGGLPEFAREHVLALEPQVVPLFRQVTDPPSRGTPYGSLGVRMPVAASMGFWGGGDYCAVRQIMYPSREMVPTRSLPIYGRYFPLSGMNLAFRPRDWLPWCRFIDVARFDDIWMGWLWQREAWGRGCCFNLAGPRVRHVRASNVWQNLRDEARYLDVNETLWARIATAPQSGYEALRGLLPV